MACTYSSFSGEDTGSLDNQRGALHSKHQCSPLIGWGMLAQEAQSAAISAAKQGGDPWGHDTRCKLDFIFVAEWVTERFRFLNDFRKAISVAVSDLAASCDPLDIELRRQQPPTVREVAGMICIGLLAALCILTMWPDQALPS